MEETQSRASYHDGDVFRPCNIFLMQQHAKHVQTCRRECLHPPISDALSDLSSGVKARGISRAKIGVKLDLQSPRERSCFFFFPLCVIMGEKSWVYTVFTQVCLCIALYVALNLGRSQEHRDYTKNVIRSSGGFLDSYFVTVRGGSRAPNEQTRLLRLMEKVSRTYGAEFVVNISELGEDDPLMQNGTQKYQSLKIPWYTPKTSKGGRSYFRERMKIPHGKTLELIGLDTGLFKGSVMMGSSVGLGEEQLKWLTKILEEKTGEWRIIAGFLPLISCQESEDLFEAKADLDPLSGIFATYGVNAYLSGRAGMHPVHEGGVTYIGDPGRLYKKSNTASSHGSSSVFCRELADGFLLHRVTALEIVTYFVNLSGEAVYKTVLRHPGKEVM